MWYRVWQTEFFVILSHFILPFYPNNNPKKNKILKKWKKTPGDIIILHMCTKNHDHMLYCSLDMAHDGYNFYFSFWAIFCPFTPLTAQKIKIKKKINLQISLFCICVTKLWSHDVQFLRYWAWLFFFTFYPLKYLENQNFDKKKKDLGSITILHMRTINDNHILYGSWEISSFYTSAQKIMIIRLVMANDRCNFYFSFWVTFWRFVPLTTKIKKK